eukprot:TRINITY_DN2705_c0_g1_i1.p1 TRINITY_DN2705_c0_g1~~TRINITY_DN2705_c0_g1_i1.p1  ORF type:complete len:488 (-),score=125.92 TRINITY_DN2705_c0_g1_i1:79-1542(-)
MSYTQHNQNNIAIGDPRNIEFGKSNYQSSFEKQSQPDILSKLDRMKQSNRLRMTSWKTGFDNPELSTTNQSSFKTPNNFERVKRCTMPTSQMHLGDDVNDFQTSAQQYGLNEKLDNDQLKPQISTKELQKSHIQFTDQTNYQTTNASSYSRHDYVRTRTPIKSAQKTSNIVIGDPKQGFSGETMNQSMLKAYKIDSDIRQKGVDNFGLQNTHFYFDSTNPQQYETTTKSAYQRISQNDLNQIAAGQMDQKIQQFTKIQHPFNAATTSKSSYVKYDLKDVYSGKEINNNAHKSNLKLNQQQLPDQYVTTSSTSYKNAFLNGTEQLKVDLDKNKFQKSSIKIGDPTNVPFAMSTTSRDTFIAQDSNISSENAKSAEIVKKNLQKSHQLFDNNIQHFSTVSKDSFKPYDISQAQQKQVNLGLYKSELVGDRNIKTNYQSSTQASYQPHKNVQQINSASIKTDLQKNHFNVGTHLGYDNFDWKTSKEAAFM